MSAARGTWSWILRLAFLVALGTAMFVVLRFQRGGTRPLPNVVVAVFDTTRPDHLPVYGYPRETAPTIAALGREARIYERAIATAPWTVPSHASIFTGRMPAELDVGWHQTHLPDGVPVIAAHFGRAGYWTVGISQNPMLTPKSGFARGFAHWSNVSQGETSAALAAALAERPPAQPLFLFVNLIAPHLPYSPPLEQRLRFLGRVGSRARFLSQQKWGALLELRASGSLTADDLDILRDLYDGEIRWADSELGDVFARLNAAGLGVDTVIAVTADHGENIGDHGLFDHQLCAYNSLLHVPLLIYAPGRVSPGRVSAPVSLKNLWRTLADIAGVSRRDVPGTSLIEPLVAVPLLSEYDRPGPALDNLARCCPTIDVSLYDRELVAVQEQRFKLIFSSDGRHELYDLQRDPREQHDLYAAPPNAETSAALRRLEMIARAAAEPTHAPAAPLSAAEREHLRALGYLADEPR